MSARFWPRILSVIASMTAGSGGGTRSAFSSAGAGVGASAARRSTSSWTDGIGSSGVSSLASSGEATLGRSTGVALILDDDERRAVTLSASGPRELHARAGQMVVLEVRLRSDGGEPIAGSAVRWTVDGAADLLDGSVVTTDREGRASQRVRVSQSPGLLAVRAVAADGGGYVAEPQTVLFQIEVGQPPG